MAFFFNGTQFDREYTPRRMCNWEVPRWSPSRARPLHQRPSPKPVADLNGRFLDPKYRGTSGPFGHYVGTWELPRRITRKVAEEITKEPPDNRFSTWRKPVDQRRKVATEGKVDGVHQAGKTTSVTRDGGHTKTSGKRNDLSDSSDKENQLDNSVEIKPNVEEGKILPYIAGSIVDTTDRIDDPTIHDSGEANLRNIIPESISSIDKDEDMKKESKNKLPLICDNTFATRRKMDNLKHQPLADRMMFRQLPINKDDSAFLNVKPYAVALKAFTESPTSCTKNEVHRPKTTASNDETQKMSTETRPATTQVRKPKELSKMDLAIYWDMRPRDSNMEPKLKKHIDGSNGSQAPAVFTLVHTPKAPDIIPKGHTNPLFTQNTVEDNSKPHALPNFEKDLTKMPSKESCEVQYCPQHSSGKRNSARSFSSKLKNAASSKERTHSEDNSKDNKRNNDLPHERNTLRQSSPNPSMTKMSPKSRSSSSKNTPITISSGEKQVKVPKMREPIKRSYVIPTLAPPFSVWKESDNIGYPEHWRLASVYQHAFKPPECRKKPLIASVFQ